MDVATRPNYAMVLDQLSMYSVGVTLLQAHDQARTNGGALSLSTPIVLSLASAESAQPVTISASLPTPIIIPDDSRAKKKEVKLGRPVGKSKRFEDKGQDGYVLKAELTHFATAGAEVEPLIDDPDSDLVGTHVMLLAANSLQSIHLLPSDEAVEAAVNDHCGITEMLEEWKSNNGVQDLLHRFLMRMASCFAVQWTQRLRALVLRVIDAVFGVEACDLTPSILPLTELLFDEVLRHSSKIDCGDETANVISCRAFANRAVGDLVRAVPAFQAQQDQERLARTWWVLGRREAIYGNAEAAIELFQRCRAAFDAVKAIADTRPQSPPIVISDVMEDNPPATPPTQTHVDVADFPMEVSEPLKSATPLDRPSNKRSNKRPAAPPTVLAFHISLPNCQYGNAISHAALDENLAKLQAELTVQHAASLFNDCKYLEVVLALAPLLNVPRTDEQARSALPKVSAVAGEVDETADGPKKPRANIIEIPRDAEGKPILPLHIGTVAGGFTLHSLGTIRDGPEYHNSRNIYPVGFKTTRQYFSMTKPEQRVVYTSEILEGPIFRVTAEDDKEHPIDSEKPSNVWLTVLTRINDAKTSGKRKTVSVSGPEMYGLAHPNIPSLIEELPGARELTLQKYIWRGPPEQAAAALAASAPQTRVKPAKIGAWPSWLIAPVIPAMEISLHWPLLNMLQKSAFEIGRPVIALRVFEMALAWLSRFDEDRHVEIAVLEEVLTTFSEHVVNGTWKYDVPAVPQWMLSIRKCLCSIALRCAQGGTVASSQFLPIVWQSLYRLVVLDESVSSVVRSRLLHIAHSELARRRVCMHNGSAEFLTWSLAELTALRLPQIQDPELDNAMVQCYSCLHGISILSAKPHAGTSSRVLTQDSAARMFAYLLPLLHERASSRASLAELVDALDAVLVFFAEPPRNDEAAKAAYRCVEERSGPAPPLPLNAPELPFAEVYTWLYFYRAKILREKPGSTELVVQPEDEVWKTIDFYRRDLICNPRRRESWFALANVYINIASVNRDRRAGTITSYFCDAVRCFDYLIQLEPDRVDYWTGHATTLYAAISSLPHEHSQRKLLCKHAITSLERALALNPRTLKYHYLLGKLHFKLGSSAATILNHLQQAVALNTDAKNVLPLYRLHGTRIKLLMQGNGEHEALETCKFGGNIEDIDWFKEGRGGDLDPQRRVLVADAYLGLLECRKRVSHFHRSQYLLAKVLLWLHPADLLGAKRELSVLFSPSTPKANMGILAFWAQDNTLVTESAGKFWSWVLKYAELYLQILDLTEDIDHANVMRMKLLHVPDVLPMILRAILSILRKKAAQIRGAEQCTLTPYYLLKHAHSNYKEAREFVQRLQSVNDTNTIGQARELVGEFLNVLQQAHMSQIKSSVPQPLEEILKYCNAKFAPRPKKSDQANLLLAGVDGVAQPVTALPAAHTAASPVAVSDDESVPLPPLHTPSVNIPAVSRPVLSFSEPDLVQQQQQLQLLQQQLLWHQQAQQQQQMQFSYQQQQLLQLQHAQVQLQRVSASVQQLEQMQAQGLLTPQDLQNYHALKAQQASLQHFNNQ
eukprot:TRINITY_DN9353_c0_g1_i1.p1 TRINITY_DN9353_c0_g1~~TRINITY_DN9353_c0_g1_i1.p1  ORF type:complete len:1796 (-),score=364.86 TRINITY_DN9353_c0_g1_i1:52-4716(-)